MIKVLPPSRSGRRSLLLLALQRLGPLEGITHRHRLKPYLLITWSCTLSTPLTSERIRSSCSCHSRIRHRLL
ncbi:hypothetical protein DL93DRAFT_2090622 [Clavulina sp. PMI_390]|nr:hypothetical protein DL93DRAFT_2090622 [Clavulina sp. PMI_390]